MTVRPDLMAFNDAPIGERDTPFDLDGAMAWCERYAKQHYENFSVVTRFLPERLHAPMYVVYSFCRYTDDLGDEAEGPCSIRRRPAS